MARVPMRRDDAWSLSIRDSSNTGALDPAWDRVCRLPRARALLGQDAAWLPGFVKPELQVLGSAITVIRETKLQIIAIRKRC
jgi:hypothetical protein